MSDTIISEVSAKFSQRIAKFLNSKDKIEYLLSK